jgi:hypothetical protein
VATDRGDHVLLAVDGVGYRRQLAAGGQAILPKLFTGADVLGADVIVQRGGEEGHAAGWWSSGRLALARQLGASIVKHALVSVYGLP